jgi:hypothetical protein
MKSIIFWNITPCSPLKVNRIPGVMFQKIVLFITMAVRTKSPTYIKFLHIKSYHINYITLFAYITCTYLHRVLKGLQGDSTHLNERESPWHHVLVCPEADARWDMGDAPVISTADALCGSCAFQHNFQLFVAQRCYPNLLTGILYSLL